MKFNSREATQISGLSLVDQSRLASRGLSRVTKSSSGQFFYDEIGILGLVLVKTLRKGGLEFDAIAPLCQFVNDLTHDELDLASAVGLFIIASPGLAPRFVPPTTVAANGTGADTFVIHVPVCVFWERVKLSAGILEQHTEQATA